MKGRGASKGRGLLLLLLLGLLSGYSRVVLADWTGVMVTLEDDSTDWLFAGGNRQARSSRIRFMVEEKTAAALRVGVDIGHLSLRVVDPATSLAEKYDAQSLGAYLRLPLALGEHFSLDSLFTYRYNNGSGNDNLAPLDIEWSEANLQIGIGVTVASFRITPFAAYASIDGDVSGSGRNPGF